MHTFLLTTPADSPETLAAFGVLYSTLMITMLVGYVITSYFASTFFAKIGEPRWKAWVPVYANWVFLTRGGVNGAFAFLALATGIPYVGMFASIGLLIALAYAAIKFGKDFTVPGPGYVALYLLLTPVWFGILGLGKAVYEPAEPAAVLETSAGPASEPSTPYTAR
jgi:hypothetical protein